MDLHEATECMHCHSPLGNHGPRAGKPYYGGDACEWDMQTMVFEPYPDQRRLCGAKVLRKHPLGGMRDMWCLNDRDCSGQHRGWTGDKEEAFS